jgi:phage terminase large subunit-like protein
MATLAPDRWSVAADILDPPPWEPRDRPPLGAHQSPPPELHPGGKDLWILSGGRGAGKTEGAARYFARWMRRHPGHRGRIIGPTLGDVVESCIDGPSGLRNIDPEVRVVTQAGGLHVHWPNGSVALCIGTPTPRDVDRLRASGNRHIDWWEEAAANPQLKRAWAQAEFGLRLGEFPHSIVSTTPQPIPAYRDLVNAPTTVVTRGTIFDNPNLPDARKQKLIDRYEGTRLGRQELYGELLDDVEGALWTWGMIEAARALWVPDPDLTRVLVAIDPSVTSGEDADVTGIIGAGRRSDGLGVVLADRSVQGVRPREWASRAVRLYDDLSADRIIAERNNGGEMVEDTIRAVRPGVPYGSVVASRGKQTRAEPISALFEQERVALAPGLDDLADELTSWVPDSGLPSPGRLDAMVWALTRLRIASQRPARVSRPTGTITQPRTQRRRSLSRRIA